MICPVCGTEVESLTACEKCGFNDIRTDFNGEGS